MAKEIELTQGYRALVDDEDFEYLNQFNWCIDSNGYGVRKGKRKSLIPMHRVILERRIGRRLASGELPDHKDGNGLNNTRQNLRVSTWTQNARNKRKTESLTSSRFKGVSWNRTNRRWQVQIRIDRKLIYIGQFKDEILAAKAYDKQALLQFGEFANINFPTQ